ncbi:cytochrome P450 [Streptomyces sp. NPDC004959]|uniref:cytochrome P450 n=1 Tax=unclassified Streptomyces TaxID=2593676 RepID=UPI0004CC8A3B|nr:cytochrome P450 [Streptomyces sp. NRRL F-5630]
MTSTLPTAPLPPLHRIPSAPCAAPHPVVLPDGTAAWRVSRYADVREVLGGGGFTRAALYAEEHDDRPSGGGIVDDPELLFNQDGPEHLRLRRTVGRAFTPRAVARWEPWITATVEELLDELVRREGPFDLVSGLARPLPVSVITRLLGLGGDAWEKIGYWSDLAFTDGSHSAAEVESGLADFTRFGGELLALRRKEPGDDLVSGLVGAADAEGGIPESQLVRLVCGMVVGGHDSTMTMLGNVLLYLLGERRDAWPRLTDVDAAGRAADRLLHFVPLGEDPGSLRRCVAGTDLGGVRIPAGAIVVADIVAANRDPEVFPPAEAEDLFRELPAPTLAFGGGPHYCMGAWLARLELRTALNRLATRLPGLRLVQGDGGVEWRLGTTSRGPKRLMARG